MEATATQTMVTSNALDFARPARHMVETEVMPTHHWPRFIWKLPRPLGAVRWSSFMAIYRSLSEWRLSWRRCSATPLSERTSGQWRSSNI